MNIYYVDAFANDRYKGNPAAVCILESYPADEILQKTAIETHQPETAFLVPEGESWHMRWFGADGEIDLCGHATLASAYIITQVIKIGAQKISFNTLSGTLTVTRDRDSITLNLPAFPLRRSEITDEIISAIGIRPQEVFIGEDIVCVLKNESEVRSVVPNQEMINRLAKFAFHITAPGDTYDCVTRTFLPGTSFTEDAVCGRGYCHITPLWTQRLGKTHLHAYQASQRGGELICRHENGRVYLTGTARLQEK